MHGRPAETDFTAPEMVDGQPFSVLELAERHQGYQGFLPPQAGQPDAIHGALIPRLESSRVAIVLCNATFWGRGGSLDRIHQCAYNAPATRTALIGSFDCGLIGRSSI